MENIIFFLILKINKTALVESIFKKYIRSAHPSLAVVTRKKCISIATMLVGFFDPLSTSPCICEKHLLGKL